MHLHTITPRQRVPNNYETDLIKPILAKAAAIAGVDYAAADASTQTALKVVGDHIRAVVYLITDGVTPSNVGRGYIVRRLLRRVILKVCSEALSRLHCCACWVHSAICACASLSLAPRRSPPMPLFTTLHPPPPCAGPAAGHQAALYTRSG